MSKTNLHISDEKCKQHQARDGNEHREANFPHKGTCLEVLTQRTAKYENLEIIKE